VSDVFGISVSALQAFQQAINVVSNNVANASTPGYDRETVNLSEALPQSNGSAHDRRRRSGRWCFPALIIRPLQPTEQLAEPSGPAQRAAKLQHPDR